jgi:hypothetical protein
LWRQSRKSHLTEEFHPDGKSGESARIVFREQTFEVCAGLAAIRQWWWQVWQFSPVFVGNRVAS